MQLLPFFSPIHNNNKQWCIYIEMLQNAMLLNSQDLLNLWNASVYIHIYYLLEKQSNGLKQTAVPNQFNMKNRSAEQKSHDKKGSRVKKLCCKKLQWIHNKKCAMCEWDHWNSIGANPARYHCKFVMSKSRQICIMCQGTYQLLWNEHLYLHKQLLNQSMQELLLKKDPHLVKRQ